jgi:hypothetical protein
MLFDIGFLMIIPCGLKRVGILNVILLMINVIGLIIL